MPTKTADGPRQRRRMVVILPRWQITLPSGLIPFNLLLPMSPNDWLSGVPSNGHRAIASDYPYRCQPGLTGFANSFGGP